MDVIYLERFEKKYKRGGADDCWLWTGSRNKDGYGKFKINKSTKLAHRLSYEIMNGPIPGGMLACHRCDMPSCVNPAHLFLGTQRDNVRDMVRKGRCHPPRGEAHCLTSLTDEKVRSIRSIRADSGMTTRNLAKMFGVSPTSVCQLLRRETWTHL